MANVYTFQNIKGYRLGSICEEKLEKKIHDAIKSKAEINKLSEKLQDKYIKQMKAFDRERKEWNQDLLRNNTEIQKLRTHTLQVINEHKQLQNENTNLISHNVQKDIFIAEFKAENITKSKKIKSLESMIKILESKLSSAQKDVISIQNDSSKKESKIMSLKSKIAELENIKSELKEAKPRDYVSSKVNEFECLKSETISKPIVGGDNEKNITKSDNISLGSTDLSKYFICGKNMDQTEKTDGNILTYTNDEIIKLLKNNTEANSK
ncbi:20676_t:CDS:2 [Cetraspora pellucida]|uniref:20676_t:CDS:1 n=1 Tax=Cetraspora pellucida TaxID=1433469 RepID=A0A9N9CAL1_9GLOM|nr:20676_t:CDS:2 [Cetraspora pellucida]